MLAIFANRLQKERCVTGVLFRKIPYVLAISPLNSIVVEQGGKLSELGLSPVQLSEEDEDLA